MKNILAAVFFTTLSCQLTAQKKNTTYVLYSKAQETNFGFNGRFIGIEHEMKLKPRAGILLGLGYFSSNQIPDQPNLTNQSNRGLYADATLQLKLSKRQGGLSFTAGPVTRYQDVNHTTSYTTNTSGDISDLKSETLENLDFGYKLGVQYKLRLGRKFSINPFIDGRFIDIKSEPSLLTGGIKLGF